MSIRFALSKPKSTSTPSILTSTSTTSTRAPTQPIAAFAQPHTTSTDTSHVHTHFITLRDRGISQATSGEYQQALMTWKEATRYIDVLCQEKEEMNDEATRLYEQMVSKSTQKRDM